MQKENLIIVHSFPGNSILLSGLIDYLSDYFEVYFIDLPGFIKAVPALTEISFEGYAKFIEEKIQEFELKNYWLGGISFGFFLISHIRLDPKCKGILGMEPYVGLASLKLGFFKRMFYRLFCKSVLALNLYTFLWSNPLSRKYLPKLRPYPPEHTEMLFNELDSRTFFKTAALILEHKAEANLKNLPHILMANRYDQTLDYDYTLRAFTESINLLLIVNISLDHFPRELSKAYFKAHLPEGLTAEVRNFMSNIVGKDMTFSHVELKRN